MALCDLLSTDPTTLQALLGRLPDREADAERWQRRLQPWLGAVEASGRRLGTLLVSHDGLRTRFHSDAFGAPNDDTIRTVLEEMVSAGLLLPASSVGQAGGWRGWLARLLPHPAWLRRAPAADQPLVLVNQLVEQSAQLEQRFVHEAPMFVDELLAAWRPDAADAPTPAADAAIELELLLLHLQGRSRLHRSDAVDDRPAVKFGAAPVSDVERSVLRLRHDEHRLARLADALRADTRRCTEAAKQCHRMHDKAGALRQLRRRQRVAAALEQREAAREQLHTLLIRIDASAADRQVLEAYRLGAETLKLARGDLSADYVHDVLGQVADALADQDEVDAALATPVSTAATVADEELEAELEALEAAHIAASLPSVPLAQPHLPEPTTHEELGSMMDKLCVS
eukprot:TRINITY_DN8790_c0_g1_i1.p1 TRINITY_DN8790_c0_g1~~TRINITY_DN8790_c0_g1_i1.p1  ORF type:complete len:399 (+),score=171.27 TRINITY_DN8790_c0_g1_i1:395-1591(+)